LLQKHPEHVFNYENVFNILNLISDSLLTCNVSARHMRLRCILSLVKSLVEPTDLLKAAGTIIGEVLICQKDANKKSRDAASDLLEHFIKHSPPEQFFNLLCSVSFTYIF